MNMTKTWNDLADVQEIDYSDHNNLLIIDANNNNDKSELNIF